VSLQEKNFLIFNYYLHMLFYACFYDYYWQLLYMIWQLLLKLEIKSETRNQVSWVMTKETLTI